MQVKLDSQEPEDIQTWISGRGVDVRFDFLLLRYYLSLLNSFQL
jgi:hypothetical protein